MDTNHKLMSIADTIELLGALEHLRSHLILASVNSPDDESLSYLILASECQKARREIQKKYFPNVEERNWCIVKCASRLLQLTEETAAGDLDEIKKLKHIVDDAIEISTGEDISFCRACHDDAEIVE